MHVHIVCIPERKPDYLVSVYKLFLSVIPAVLKPESSLYFMDSGLHGNDKLAICKQILLNNCRMRKAKGKLT